MTIRSEKVVGRSDPSFAAAIALMSTAIACAIVLFAVPRPARLELPVLLLDMTKVRAQLADDSVFAARPATPLMRELDRVLLEVGRSEFDRDPRTQTPASRALPGLKARAQSELGEDGLKAVRAYATERFMRALSFGLADAQEEHGVVGAVFDFLLVHGYVMPDGTLLAPELSVRATYKVRWNMLFGFLPTAGLSPIERRAYEGFRALEAENMPDVARHAALQALLNEGSDVTFQRAAAIWQAEAGSKRMLLRYLDPPAEGLPNLRMRNMAVRLVPAPDPF